MSEIPEHSWRPWRFGATSLHGWWADLAHKFNAKDPKAIELLRAYFLEELAPALGIRGNDINEWFYVLPRLSYSQLKRFESFGGINSVLSQVFPSAAGPITPSLQPSEGMHGFNLLNMLTVTSIAAAQEPRTKSKRTKPIKDLAYWRLADNRALFMKQLKESLGNTMDSLYRVNSQTIKALNGM